MKSTKWTYFLAVSAMTLSAGLAQAHGQRSKCESPSTGIIIEYETGAPGDYVSADPKNLLKAITSESEFVSVECNGRVEISGFKDRYKKLQDTYLEHYKNGEMTREEWETHVEWMSLFGINTDSCKEFKIQKRRIIDHGTHSLAVPDLSVAPLVLTDVVCESEIIYHE